MISTLSIWQWVKLIISLFLFISPGMLFLSLSRRSGKVSLPMGLIFSFGASFGFWILLLIWLQLFDLSFNSLAVRLLFSALFLIHLFQTFKIRGKILEWFKNRANLLELLLIGFGILIIGIYLYFYRNLAAGMGSDSMHHTLIASLFIENGQIPENYGPYAPVVTFSYHFGFHAYIAAMSLLSGIAPRLMVVISGAILMGFASLAGGALVYYLTKRTMLGVVAEAIIGFIFVFPSYSLIWGRYTQLIGTIMLMIYLLALFYWEDEHKFSFRYLPLLITITIGLIFAHYRICIAGIIFTIIYLFVRIKPLLSLKKHLAEWLTLPLGAIILSSPWLIQLLIARQAGFTSPSGGQPESTFFSLDRLGPFFHGEIQTWLLIGLGFIGVLSGLLNKDRVIRVVALWVLVMAFISHPGVLGHTIDPITLMVSSYVPIIILICSGISNLMKWHPVRSQTKIINGLISLLLLFGIISGLNRWRAYNFSNETYLTDADLKAGSWIKANISEDALFMINTHQFNISDRLTVGRDGGYWLPVTAERQTVVPPMIYFLEKKESPEVLDELLSLFQLKGEITSQEALDLLEESGVDYVYIGAKGGNINVGSLNRSEHFEIVYQKDQVSVYKIRY